MTWDEHFLQWVAVWEERRPRDSERVLDEARRRVGSNDDADWRWLAEALADPARKYFVAEVFRFQPVPKRLLGAFVRAAVVDVDVSTNRRYLTPCVESFGRDEVVAELDRLRESSVATARMHEAAMYWIEGAGSSHGRR